MLRKLFALTEQGVKDLKKGIIASVFASLSLMLPMGLLLMLVMQLLQPLLGIDAAAPSLGTYTGMCLILLAIIFLIIITPLSYMEYTMFRLSFTLNNEMVSSKVASGFAYGRNPLL